MTFEGVPAYVPVPAVTHLPLSCKRAFRDKSDRFTLATSIVGPTRKGGSITPIREDSSMDGRVPDPRPVDH
jgi:hypothetical protein